MAQIVEPDRRQARLGHQTVEEVRHLARMELGAVLLGEDPAGLLPGRTPFAARRVLVLLVEL
ncbi:hypothetical protein GCM10009863_19600 [Streptomyces axinellae]|uniref:Uncharacterized protein n=1 Tax=Streptomyces axinellae TaxID=552788 RepID=A0ABP6C8D8_9ACTN